MNPQIKSILLLGLISIVFLGIGYLFGNVIGLIITLLIALGLNFISYFYSDKIVLSFYKTKACEDPEILSMVKKIAMKAKIPMPKVYIAEVNYPNAFATGRNPENAAVVLTKPLIQLLDKDELEAVIAHELGHIKNRDVLVATLASAIATAITFFLEISLWFFHDEEGPNIWGILIIYLIAIITLPIIQFAISRQREFMADEFSAKMTLKPRALISALRRLNEFYSQSKVTISPSQSALMIFSPKELFSTHPSFEARAKRLIEIEKKLIVKH